MKQQATLLPPMQSVGALKTAHRGHKAMKLKLYDTNTKRQLFIASYYGLTCTYDNGAPQPRRGHEQLCDTVTLGLMAAIVSGGDIHSIGTDH